MSEPYASIAQAVGTVMIGYWTGGITYRGFRFAVRSIPRLLSLYRRWMYCPCDEHRETIAYQWVDWEHRDDYADPLWFCLDCGKLRRVANYDTVPPRRERKHA